MPIKIDLLLEYIERDGTDSRKTMTVRLSDPVRTNKGMFGDGPMDYSASFSLRIPDHIWSFLAGRTVPSFGVGDKDSRPHKYGKTVKTFSKTLSSFRLQEVCQAWTYLLKEYRWLRDVDDRGLDKVIFYDFDNAAGDFNDQWSGKIPLGAISRIKFRYAIGYRIPTKSRMVPDECRFNHEMVMMSKYSDKDLYEMQFVTWTEARQEFFEKMQSNF